MLREFLRNRGGNYAIAVAVAFVPLMGALSVGIDYAEMSRQREATLSALDAAGIATARQIVSGASDAAVLQYARDFFDANLGPVDPADAQLSVALPQSETGGGTLKLSATLNYRPYFFPVFQSLAGRDSSPTVEFKAATEIRLKNTLEVALVLDNSGSMSQTGTDSGLTRMALLKDSAKQLIDTLALQAQQMKQVDKPVQFGVVPFAASVNVGPQYADAAWMDTLGLSPVHHENFDWSTLTDPTRTALKVNGIWKKSGIGWGLEEGEVLSRFSLYKDMKRVDSREWVSTGQEWVCTRYYSNGSCRSGKWQETGYYDETIGTYASWQGCVESRPYPLNVSDASPSAGISDIGMPYGDPATLFVPMFAPDEPGDRWTSDTDTSLDNFSAANNWWNDGTESSSGLTRQRNMTKYFEVRPYGVSTSRGSGPNYSCTTTPITSLTDVTVDTGLTTVKTAIDAMSANGNTNVPEGIAWGWRVVSSGEPFTEGRPESEKGNDKVVIILTDGANTYSTAGQDPAGNKSTYAAYGYAGLGYNGTGTTRLFMGTSGLGTFDYSSSNYTSALDQQMASVCTNAKAAGIMVMTVSLDLSTSNSSENQAIEALKSCASDSRFRRDANGNPEKLYWNATGGTLSDIFKRIADELSNLRIVS